MAAHEMREQHQCLPCAHALTTTGTLVSGEQFHAHRCALTWWPAPRGECERKNALPYTKARRKHHE